MNTEQNRKAMRVKAIIFFLIALAIMPTITTTAMATESTMLPQPMTIRKTTLEDNQLYVWIYISTDIKTITHINEDQETMTMYTYDMEQIKIPLNQNQLTPQELQQLSDSTYTQDSIKYRLTNQLKTTAFVNILADNINIKTKTVDQREQESIIKSATIIKSTILTAAIAK